MQGKVSMVMPCYNKADYIGEMFDSIIGQEWDNVELIIVNDGSTDATRDVIEQYKARLCGRGFEVVIVDQENAGVCAAAKAGLERITGDYVCMVDADDELDSKYVSIMAGWLQEHEEFDYTVCDHLCYVGTGCEKEFRPSGYPIVENGCPDMTVRYLLYKLCGAVWSYMVRTEYLKKCRIVETFDTSTKGTHEPCYMIPLTAYGGRVKSFSETLYRFNYTDAESHSRPGTFDKQHSYRLETLELHKRAIGILPCDVANDATKKHFLEAANLRYLKDCASRTHMAGGEEKKAQITEEIVVFLNSTMWLCKPLKANEIVGKETVVLECAERYFMKEKHQPQFRPDGRIIGYGALGKIASRLLPILKDTIIEPTELWDKNADGIVAQKPKFDSLNKDDVLLVFPVGAVENELRIKFNEVPFNVYYSTEIRDILVNELYCTNFRRI